jgi:hypothetical protein
MQREEKANMLRGQAERGGGQNVERTGKERRRSICYTF